MKTKTFYVQITKSEFSSYWYAKHIGEIFSVTNDPKYPESYLLVNNAGWIEKADCKRVKINVYPTELTSF